MDIWQRHRGFYAAGSAIAEALQLSSHVTTIGSGSMSGDQYQLGPAETT